MIRHSAFAVEPWRIREASLDLEVLAQTESVFALANGHLGLRGNLDEGEPYGLPGTYLNSVYDLRPFATAEPAYGDPEFGQTVINVTNGKLIRLLVDDEPCDVRYGAVRRTSASSTCAPAPWSGEWSGRRQQGRRSASRRSAWCRSPSARSPPSATWSSQWTLGRDWSSSPS